MLQQLSAAFTHPVKSVEIQPSLSLHLPPSWQCNIHYIKYIRTNVIEADDLGSHHLQGQTSTRSPGHHSVCPIGDFIFKLLVTTNLLSRYHVIHENLPLLGTGTSLEQIVTTMLYVYDVLYDIVWWQRLIKPNRYISVTSVFIRCPQITYKIPILKIFQLAQVTSNFSSAFRLSVFFFAQRSTFQ